MRLLRLLAYVWWHRLNTGGRLHAVARVFRWQFASRMLPGPLALPFIDDTKLFVSRGMTGATGNWYCGLHEAEEMGFVLHYLRPDDLFVDVGANIGSYTIMVAGTVEANVISVEPILRTYSNLQQNIMLNGLAERVESHCTGLSSERSVLQFTSNQDTVNHVMTGDDQGPAIRAPAISMDEMLNGRVALVIKIDVEGREHAVLEGAERTLSNEGVSAVVMEINGSGSRYGVDDDELLELMSGYGFAPFGYDPIMRRLRDWDRSCANAIFVRDRKETDDRVAKSKQYRLANRSI